MTALYLYDDARARSFEPFALTRPASELRAGALLIRERWERALDTRAAGAIAAPHLADFDEPGSPGVTSASIPAGSIVANARCVVALRRAPDDADAWTCDGGIAAVRVGTAIPFARLADGGLALDSLAPARARTADIPGRWVDQVWNLVMDLPAVLVDDIAAIGPTLECERPSQAIVLGSHPVYVERGATVEPQVVFDVSAAPVLVRRGAVVRAFTRLVGPCAIASQATVLGERVQGCSIGEMSFVKGELSETIVLGHANKSHDGFVGNSYLGRWVNLGAGTITSNLKNTYGTVAMWTPSGVRDTGALKLGTLFGDHVKLGIGMRLTTGTVLGAGSNLYGNAMPPKYVPPFSWGEADRLDGYRIDKFLGVAERAMARRQVALSPRAARQLQAAYERGRGRAPA